MRRTIDLLASRPEVNPKRIGIAGISLGGILAATAAEADGRIYRAALILAGGDLGRIVAHARETRELRRFLDGLSAGERVQADALLRTLDPLEKASLLRNRAVQGRVMMINAAEDEVIPRECTERLAAALGISQRTWRGWQAWGITRPWRRCRRRWRRRPTSSPRICRPARPGRPRSPQPTPCRRWPACSSRPRPWPAPSAEGRGHFADLAIRFGPLGRSRGKGCCE